MVLWHHQAQGLFSVVWIWRTDFKLRRRLSGFLAQRCKIKIKTNSFEPISHWIGDVSSNRIFNRTQWNRLQIGSHDGFGYSAAKLARCSLLVLALEVRHFLWLHKLGRAMGNLKVHPRNCNLAMGHLSPAKDLKSERSSACDLISKGERRQLPLGL